ncbi:hypothetical protein VMCG_01603 [Cytospora schulzeri]|uniref:Uncharacterized protein n=1 Tax=Cytospora schulzeri TaxID=448051 RepID=A0A423X3R0_9PEZI|nr:hypothetical protein VMCG_01603 [Valsa malicola]
MDKSVDIDPLLMETDVLPTKRASLPKNFTLYMWRLWIETYNELRYDLKPTRLWRTVVEYYMWFLFSIWALGIIIFSILFPIALSASWEAAKYLNQDYCAPDGSFSLEVTNPWRPAWAFQIVLGMGSLNFTQAKAIDIVWDIVVGRFGQAILAYYSWKAFAAYVRVSMEYAPITYSSFRTSFMQGETSFRSTVRMIRDFTSRRGLRSKTAMVFMVTTMVFVMVFPTLASAMTGYTAKNEAVIKLADSTQTPFAEFFERLDYTIHDAYRVNLTADFHVISHADMSHYLLMDYIPQYGIRNDTPSNWSWIGLWPENIDHIELQSPTLDITVYDGKVSDEAFLCTQNNETYSLPYISEHAVCQPATTSLKQTYQWGFSVLQLEVTLILLTFWTFGVWIMWLRAHLELTSRGKHEVPHGLKAVLYLADSIRDDFDSIGEEAESLSDEELRRHAKEQLGGGKVKIEAPESQTRYSLRRSLWHWLKTNSLWTLAFTRSGNIV